MIAEYFISSNPQKVLQYLLLHSGKECYERQVARGAKISYGSANRVLNDFSRQGIVKRKNEGRMSYYKVDVANPFVHEFKILINLVLLESLVEKLKPLCEKVVLFGSCALGADTQKSDIDLYILSSDKESVHAIINKFSYSDKVAKRKIQAVVDSPADILRDERENKVFMEEVAAGKILWERGVNEPDV